MKNKVILVIIVILAGYIGYITRDYLKKNWKQVGVLSMSKTIKDSKKKGVYIWSYSPPQNPYIVNDTLSIYVKEAWLEKTFRVPEYGNGADVQNSSSYQLVMTLSDRRGNYSEIPYSIVNKKTKSGMGKRISLLLNIFDEFPIEDTLEYEIKIPMKNDSFAPPVKKIGEFQLIRDSVYY